MADAGERPGTAWTRVTAACGAAGLPTAATLQAVDGVALKAMVDLWAGAANDRSALFAAALAVRPVEIGLDALLALVLAATFLGFGVGLLTAPPRPQPGCSGSHHRRRGRGQRCRPGARRLLRHRHARDHGQRRAGDGVAAVGRAVELAPGNDPAAIKTSPDRAPIAPIAPSKP
jgi:hypothetical protein